LLASIRRCGAAILIMEIQRFWVMKPEFRNVEQGCAVKRTTSIWRGFWLCHWHRPGIG